jgi:hypothetical protein
VSKQTFAQSRNLIEQSNMRAGGRAGPLLRHQAKLRKLLVSYYANKYMISRIKQSILVSLLQQKSTFEKLLKFKVYMVYGKVWPLLSFVDSEANYRI